jgi:hypothetical protein
MARSNMDRWDAPIGCARLTPEQQQREDDRIRALTAERREGQFRPIADPERVAESTATGRF